MYQTTELALNEFTFRYLYPLEGEEEFRPLNSLEKGSQFEHGVAGDKVDISDIISAAVTGLSCAYQTRMEKLLYALAQTHLPNYITTDSHYGKHAEYPSPRSYYPLVFILHQIENGQSRYFRVDLDDWNLVRVADTDYADLGPLADNTLLIQTNFNIYNKLYNRFRYGLFCLESGHFHRAFERNLTALGLTSVMGYSKGRLHLTFSEVPLSAEHNEVELGKRTSGFFHHGLYPRKMDSSKLDMTGIARHFHEKYQQFIASHPMAAEFDIRLKAVIDNQESMSTGIYEVGCQNFSLLQPGRFMTDIQEAYNYNNFSFIHTSCVFFFTIRKGSLKDNTRTVCCNNTLGYLSQCLIEYFSTQNLFARPFRSYDQFQLDSLLNHQLDDSVSMTYYGLLIGENRATQPLGAIK